MKQLGLLIIFVLIPSALSEGTPKKERPKPTLDPKSFRKENSFGLGATITRTLGSRPRPLNKSSQPQPSQVKPLDEGNGQQARIEMPILKEEIEVVEEITDSNVDRMDNVRSQSLEESSKTIIKINNDNPSAVNKPDDDNLRQAKIKGNINEAQAKFQKFFSELEKSEIESFSKSLENKELSDKIRNNIEVSLKKLESGFISETPALDDLDLDFVFDEIELPSIFNTDTLFSDTFFANSRPKIGNNDVILSIGDRKRQERRVMIMEIMRARHCLSDSQKETFNAIIKSQKLSNQK